jgi:hypothetical protein
MSRKFEKAFEKLKKASISCDKGRKVGSPHIRQNERPKYRYLRCPVCKRRMRTTFVDMHPDELISEWVEYIPKHVPKK